MKITIDCTAEEAENFPQSLGLEKGLGDLMQEALTIKQNKEALHRFQNEVFNGHDWSIETLSRHLHPDFVDHAAMPGDLPGLEGVQSRFSAWQAAFEGAAEENIEMVGEADLLAVLYDLHAKHTGTFMGIEPNNSEVIIPGIEFLRFKDGKIYEHWGIYDFMSTAEEIGAEMTFVPKATRGIPRRPQVAWDPRDTAVDDAGGQGN